MPFFLTAYGLSCKMKKGFTKVKNSTNLNHKPHFLNVSLAVNQKESQILNGKTTIKEIAKLSGVSRSTVSRVLNDDPNVNANTRAKIQAIIKEVGYQPSPVARSLISGRSRVLGLVIPTLFSHLASDPFFSLLAQGISLFCNTNDYTLILWLVEPDYEEQTRQKILENRLVDGIIVASNAIDDPLIQGLVNQNMPLVQVGRSSIPSVSSVDADNVNGAILAVEHLVSIGRTKLATITGPMDRYSGQDRLEGFKQGLQAHNLPFSNDRVGCGDFTEEGAYQQTKVLLSRTQFDSLFVASDVMAFGAIQAILEAGLQVPVDVAVIGFDDLPEAGRHHPSLTTIRQPIQQMGVAAAKTLIQEIESKTDTSPMRHILPVELIPRESTHLSQ